MTVSRLLHQFPEPGSRLVVFQGDIQVFTLKLDRPGSGNAWIRTNIGRAAVTRREIIDRIDHNTPPLAKDWFDIPMTRVSDQEFRVSLPLTEVGHFEAKCLYLESGQSDPEWPEGSNTAINVDPADISGANTIYNAFVRQFGPNRDGGARREPEETACITRLDQLGYSVIPKSGTFRDLISELDFILGTLGCRIVHLLPIYPTPTTYARMGRFGSPYAALSFTAVDPALAEFDPRATPLEQFLELVDAIHARFGKVIIDIAPNHTGWAASLHETHPEWLAREADGRIEVPGAWGVKWEDLTRLDYSHQGLWQYMAGVFLTWCRRGVDGFRCDAGYMIPVEAWEYITAVVREQYPDTIFFLEGLGGKISVARDILNTADFNWAYSELFQNYDRAQIESYLPGAIDISVSDGLLVHFAETHDNNRLAARSHAYARTRTALCALLSHLGGFGFANGVEWFADEKINVHESSSLRWGDPENQVAHIRRLNAILREHPCFHPRTLLKLVHTGPGNVLALCRHNEPSGKTLLVAANLNEQTPETVTWHACLSGGSAFDLVTGEPVEIDRHDGLESIRLDPARVVCLSPEPSDLTAVLSSEKPNLAALPDVILRQRYRAAALEIRQYWKGMENASGLDPDAVASLLASDPHAYFRSLHPETEEPRVVPWDWPADCHRIVPVPAGHFLMVQSGAPFRAELMADGRTLSRKDSLPGAGNRHQAFFAPVTGSSPVSCTLRMSVFESPKCQHTESLVQMLNGSGQARSFTRLSRVECMPGDAVFLAVNGRGAMVRAHVSWGVLTSRYDAFLAANLNPDFPEDRRILFTRCRAWIVFQGYSQEICINCLDTFQRDSCGRGVWRFHVPCGQGEHVLFRIGMTMPEGQNAVEMDFFRSPADGRASTLPDSEPIRLILRPDIEDRGFHEVTKAYLGPENDYPARIRARENGFRFEPTGNRILDMAVSPGTFHAEIEWQYMVYRSMEAERGLDPHSDLFSPGYFSIELRGNQSARLVASADTDSRPPFSLPRPVCPPMEEISFFDEPVEDLASMMKTSLLQFVTRRNDLHSVIAGFPWFLDWGRDSLIAVRGVIAADELSLAGSILKQYARFEENGTLPNMIQGRTPANRDTSDAPLWLFVGCRELIEKSGDTRFLDSDCGGRAVRDVLVSIGEAYRKGTPNGISMDASSGLIFSPSHFTWMDTNFPAGTPREGYPVEIQALWYHALRFLARIDRAGKRKQWGVLARQAGESIRSLFWLPEEGYLSDCLHASPGSPAARATPDDALRPNQIFALTLGPIEEADRARSTLAACQSLVVPGAIRSLADRPVRVPIEIRHQGHLLNDPLHPYQGIYSGDEDTRRKPAYHNGTAWTWPFPSFCEAWYQVYGAAGQPTALSFLTSGLALLRRGCLGHLPEIVDGNAPHTPRGCDAQAWGISEFLRVWRMLS